MVSTLGWAPRRCATAAASSKACRVRPSLSGGNTVTVTGRPTRSLVAAKRLRATRSPIRDRSRQPGMRGALPTMTKGESTGICGLDVSRSGVGGASDVGDPSGLALLERADLVLGQDVPRVRGGLVPVGQHLGRPARAREFRVALDQPPHIVEGGHVGAHRIDQVGIEPGDEPLVVVVEHEHLATGLRTPNRSPTPPATNSSPPVAPYRQVLPARTGRAEASLAGGRMATRPPPMPLPT